MPHPSHKGPRHEPNQGKTGGTRGQPKTTSKPPKGNSSKKGR